MEANTRLRGRALALVRVAFVALVTLILIVGASSFYLYFTREGWQVCHGTTVECQVKLQFSTEQVADFALRGIPFEMVLAFRYAALLLSTGISLGVGLFIAARRSDDWMALLMSLLLIGAMVGNEGVVSSLTRVFPNLSLLVTPLNVLIIPKAVLALGLFPNGRPAPTWMRIGLPVMMLIMLAVTLPPPPHPQWFVLVGAFVIILGFGLLLYSQVERYRRYSTFAEQRQTKWVVVGFVLMLSTFMVGILLFSLDVFGDNQLLKAIVGTLCFTLLPGVFLAIFIGIAILRSQLWDIDILIRRTLVYGLLTALLTLFYFGSVVLLQQLLRGLTGQGSDLAIIISTLAIAALSIPLRNRVQRAIDHRFYRRKYDAARVLATFAATVRDEVDLGRLTDELQAVVQETMQPEQVSVWLKKPTGVRNAEKGGN